ncbi:hypothetical protein [Phascolarctobacterium faecium]|uniref:hypothetical protein n=1 Tax=Phascolarctobacterium faecium TaxID=33025 RepID=UPI0026663BAB|nr:hypothetical protein [Phascolarctobacterium faecium]
MDKFVQTELEGAGVNVEETLRRFMNNEMLMIKFLRKFVDDENMNKLRTLIAAKHYNEVLPVAHTLALVEISVLLNYMRFSPECVRIAVMISMKIWTGCSLRLKQIILKP